MSRMRNLQHETSPEVQDSRPDPGEDKASSLERMLSVLDMFEKGRPVWSVEELAAALDFTRSATYRYLRELAASGLVAPVATGRYSLGPRIIQLHRQLAESDPLLVAMQTLEAELPAFASEQKWHLCRLFRDRVITIGVYGHLDSDLSYRLGRPMPLLRGATSTAVLAWLPERQLMRLYLENQDAVSMGTPGALGSSWPDYRKSLADIRKRGYAVGIAEIDADVFGVAAPIFDVDGRVVGSLSVVRSLAEYRAERVHEEGEQIAGMARRITEIMKEIAGS